jgi:trimethylamine---corrinoid protein Co-methyltransferase
VKRLNGKSGFLEFLSADQVKEVHCGSLRLLEEVGVYVPHEMCLDVLQGAGAKVDFDKKTAFIPASLVEKMVALAPSAFTWHGRDPRFDMHIGDNKVYFGTMSSALFTTGLDGKRRLSSVKDAQNFSKLADALEYVNEGYCVVHPHDVPEHAHHVHMMYAMLSNTVKPFKGRDTGAQQAIDCIRMAEIVAGGKENMEKWPNLLTNVSTVSPLAHARDMMEGMIEYIKRGLPIIFTPEVQTGATGPVTLAGSLIQHNAEVLSGITMAQLISPGTPVIYGNVSSSFDMKYATLPYATAEAWLLNSATAQMSRFYSVPSRGTAGFSDANLLDMQTGFESGMSLLMIALSGVNFVIGAAGGLENATGASYAKMMIDNEIIGIVTRVLKGIDITEETKAFDVIKTAGPLGQFLMSKHTKEFFKKETFMPELSNFVKYDVWQQQGAKNIEDVAREKASIILAQHQPEPLAKDVEKELKEIIREVESRKK